MANLNIAIQIAAKDAASGPIGAIKNALGGLGSVAGSIATTGLAVATGGIVALGAGLAGLTAMTFNAAGAADELVELSDKTGLSTTQLQEFRYIGEQTGTSLETVTGSLAKLIRNMAGARDGTGPAAEAFAALGVSVIDSNGQLRDSQVVFGEALTALGNVGNETERDALAMALFGKSAQELNPLIKAGSEGIAAMSQEANNLGAVMSEEAVAGLADLNDMVAGLKLGFQGWIGTLASEFVPVFREVIGWITSTAIPVLRQFAEAYVMPALDWLVNTGLPVLWQTGLQVWGWIAGTAIPTLQQWGQTIGEFVSPKFEILRTLLENFINLVLPPLQQAWQTLQDVWQTEIGPALDELWASLNELFEELGIGTGDTDIWSVALGLLKLALAGVVTGVQLLTPIIRGLGEGIRFGIDIVRTFIEGLISLKRTAEQIIEPLQRVADKIADLIASALEMPDWLIPGSPTPFEVGLRGIGAAVRALPEMNFNVAGGGQGQALPLPSGRGELALAGGGGGITIGQITINADSYEGGQEAGRGFVDYLRSSGQMVNL